MTIPAPADGANGFDPDFADPPQWAAMYRAHRFQVVPAWSPAEHKQWKRPRLKGWREIQNELIPQDKFDSIWAENASRKNMGVITGPCSDNLFIVDLDTQKTAVAAEWWNGLLAVHNNGMALETVEQRTGGGGRQLLFRAPAGVVVPTCKTARGVDIRGQGGFAMLPPSMHESERAYEWLPGQAPGEIDVATAPAWLLEAIAALVKEHGSGIAGQAPRQGHGPAVDPAIALDPFGNVTDGREQTMRDVVWHATLELWRQNPICPPERDWPALAEAAYEDYERKVTTHIEGVSKREGLEQERPSRGTTLFWQKFRATMRRWKEGDDAFIAEAGKPPPKSDEFDDFDPQPPHGEPQIDPDTGNKMPLLLSARQFIAGFTPPNYLIDGIVQCGYIYALTARTGHGKTAVTMYFLQCVARGIPMHGRETRSGTVLLLAGENPDDVRARFLVLAEANGFDASAVKIRFISGVVNLSTRMEEIRAEAATIEDLVLVVVDTAAAYFPGDETNSNSQQGAYARLLRQLTFLRGKPAVIVNCHPIKNAARDNLLPMGGSAFVNEIDGNLTLWMNNEKQASLHWLGKMRGPEFNSMAFELKTATCDRVKDAKGRLMASVVAEPISEVTLAAGEAGQEADEDRLLRFLHLNPGMSFAMLAVKMGFVVDGEPQKYRVQRIMERLKADRMVEQYRNNKYRITRKGKKEIGIEDAHDE